jgi:hypothetical protein
MNCSVYMVIPTRLHDVIVQKSLVVYYESRNRELKT